MFLTPDELEELTGYKQPGWQLRWLKQRAWAFELARNGAPRVSRQYALQRLGVSTPAISDLEPNWDAV